MKRNNGPGEEGSADRCELGEGTGIFGFSQRKLKTRVKDLGNIFGKFQKIVKQKKTVKNCC
jgi:hypothetical protein